MDKPMMWTMMVTSMGTPQIGVVSLMLIQGTVLNMTSMVERFLSWGYSIIHSLAH